MEFIHKPVLFDEVIESLNIKPEGIYVDGTLGGGGHANVAGAQIKDVSEEEALEKVKEILKLMKIEGEI